jgi:GT2 family glycosyltransferase
MEPDNRPHISIIMPCRNEVGWIRRCLQSIADNDASKDQLEVLVVDGMSDDGTRAIVEDFVARCPYVRLLDNPKRITPTALNIGIAAARGAVIMRMDAHVEYPAGYISTLVRQLEESGADNVGGVWHTCPANESAMARAIAIGASHPLGVGNSHYRIGTTQPRWVDTVPFGCYRREVFDRIGLFDEELVRNQDDEFNLRLLRSGGRILLVPEVACRYYARESLHKVWRMHYQYGYFKPLVVRKLRGVMTLRQLVPAVFILVLTATAIGAWFSWIAAAAFGGILLAYTAAIAACAAPVTARHGLRCGLDVCIVFPVLHFSYGLGYLKGVLDFMILRRTHASRLQATPLSR